MKHLCVALASCAVVACGAPSNGSTSSDTPSTRAAAFRATFSRPVFVAEFAYGAAANTGAYASWGATGALSGIRCWAPEVYAPGWEGFAIFDGSGGVPFKNRPALDSIANGIVTPNPAVFHD